MSLIIDLIYPRRCLFCGKPVDKGYSCSKCAEDLTPLTGKMCYRCGAEKENCLCNAIVNSYDACISAIYYKGAGKNLVLRCKNAKSRPSVKLGVSFMKSAFMHYYPSKKIDIVTCVPRDFVKYIKNGENHSEIMGRMLAKSLGFKYKNLLKKVKLSKTQKRLTRFERLENISGAYKPMHKSKIFGKNILLVDDVKTTGATLNECAKALKSCGAASVYCITLAITHRDLPQKFN